MLAGKNVNLYSDSYTKTAAKEIKKDKTGERKPLAADFVPAVKDITIKNDGKLPVTILPSAGIVIKYIADWAKVTPKADSIS